MNTNYEYLLNDYGKLSKFVMAKAKLSLWFIFLVESCRKFEFEFYGLEHSYGYDESFFKEKRQRLIRDVNSIIRIDNEEESYTDDGEVVIDVLNDFVDLCEVEKKNIDIFFEKVFKDKVIVECNPVCVQ